MGLISRVSSRTYRTEKKMAEGDKITEKPVEAVDAVSTQDLDKLSGLTDLAPMSTTEALFKNLETFYKQQTEVNEKRNAHILELKKVDVEKDDITKVMKHWDLNRLEAITILKEQGGDINKAMLHLATN